MFYRFLPIVESSHSRTPKDHLKQIYSTKNLTLCKWIIVKLCVEISMTIRKDKGFYVRNYSKHPHIRTHHFALRLIKFLITADYLVITQPETVSKFVLKYYTLHSTRGLIIIQFCITYTTAVKNKEILL